MSANIPSVISDMDPLTKLLSAHRHKQHSLGPGSGTVHCGCANWDAQDIISCSYSQRCDIIGDGPGDLGGTDAHDGVLGARASRRTPEIPLAQRCARSAQECEADEQPAVRTRHDSCEALKAARQGGGGGGGSYPAARHQNAAVEEKSPDTG